MRRPEAMAKYVGEVIHTFKDLQLIVPPSNDDRHVIPLRGGEDFGGIRHQVPVAEEQHIACIHAKRYSCTRYASIM